MKGTLNWGVIGTGAIADDFAKALADSDSCKIVDAVGTSSEKASSFAARWSLPKSSASLEQLLANSAVEAVYVATPHTAHEAQALASIAAGKHVLCEKPIAVDAAGASRVIEAAQNARVLVMEAYMYRCHPMLKGLLSRLHDGMIGPLRHVRADFAFRVPRDPKGRLFDKALAGGGILDVGGYPMSFARLLAGVAEGKAFAEPIDIKAVGFVGPTGVDEVASALLSFTSGLSAALTCGVHHEVARSVIICGEAGRIVVPHPWTPEGGRHGRESSFIVQRDGHDTETVRVRTEKAIYAIEAELFRDTLPSTEARSPAMSFDDTLGNMRALDAWRAALGH